jgi:protein-tyrosine-phosphatase
VDGRSHASAIAPVRDTRPGSLALAYGLVREAVGTGVRKVSATIAREGMERMRRHPAELEDALGRATSVLMVCHGNIIRSPFAACVLRSVLGPHGIAIDSAGLEAVPGRPAHPIAIEIASAMHLDLEHHRACLLSVEQVQSADVIFAADVMQFVAIRRRFREARDKTYPLSCLAPATPLDIHDPVNGDETVFVASYLHIIDAISPIARVLSARSCAPSKTCSDRASSPHASTPSF